MVYLMQRKKIRPGRRTGNLGRNGMHRTGSAVNRIPEHAW